MTESDTGEPLAPETDESTEPEQTPDDTSDEKPPESDDERLHESAAELTALKEELGQGQADALHALTEGAGIETTLGLYEQLGHPGETVTLELTLYEAEVEQLVAIIEQATQGRMTAARFLPRCRMLSEILDEAVTPQMVDRWNDTTWEIERSDE